MNLPSISGLLLLDKPLGLSSNAALQRAKRILGIKKAGHMGTLDPLATGMLPICLGEATKFSDFILQADKVYRTHAYLGKKTTTGDAEGEVLVEKTVPADLSIDKIQTVLNEFVGEITQVPPMYSALKHQGKPLYELARQGIEIERAARTIKIFSIKLINVRLPIVELEVHCSKGTYIRTLVEDIGERLACGAHVSLLRRLQVANFNADQMVSLDELEANGACCGIESKSYKFILPITKMLAHIPVLTLSDDLVFYIRRGQAVTVSQLPPGELFLLQTMQEEFLGLAKCLSDGRVAPKRLVHFEAN